LSRTETFAQWSYLRPSRPTLIVVDYVSSRTADASSLVLQLSRSVSYLPNPVRVLLVERDQGSWWPRFLREESQSESTELIACQYEDALHLGPLGREALRAVASDTARSRQLPWTDAIAHAFERRMRTVDPLGRPLFAMIGAAYAGSGEPDAV